jgi:hypothetical protein
MVLPIELTFSHNQVEDRGVFADLHLLHVGGLLAFNEAQSEISTERVFSSDCCRTTPTEGLMPITKPDHLILPTANT